MKYITLTIILFVSLFANAQDTIVETNKKATLKPDKSLIDERHKFAEEDKDKNSGIIILGVVATLVAGAAIALFLTKRREK